MSEQYAIPPFEEKKDKDKDKSKSNKAGARAFLGMPSLRPAEDKTPNKMPPPFLPFLERPPHLDIEKTDDDEESEDDKKRKKKKAINAAPDLAKIAAPPVEAPPLKFVDSDNTLVGSKEAEASDDEESDEDKLKTDARQAEPEVPYPDPNGVFELPEVQAQDFGKVDYEDLDLHKAADSKDGESVVDTLPLTPDISVDTERPNVDTNLAVAINSIDAIPVQRQPAASEQYDSAPVNPDNYDTPREVSLTDYNQPLYEQANVDQEGAQAFVASESQPAPAADGGGSEATPPAGRGRGGEDGFGGFGGGGSGDAPQPAEATPPPDAAMNFSRIASASVEGFASPMRTASPEMTRPAGISPNLLAGALVLEHFVGASADRKITTEMRQRMDKFNDVIGQTNSRLSVAENALQSAKQEADGASTAKEQLSERIQTLAATSPNTVSAPSASLAEQPATAFEATRSNENRNVVAPPVAPPLFPPMPGFERQAPANVAAERAFTPNSATINSPSGERSITSPRMADLLEQRDSGNPNSLVPDTDLYAEANVRPSIVMEQVAQAAENDVPVEIAYERRQEVRDEPGGGGGQPSGGGAGAFGTILTDHSEPPEAAARRLAEAQAYLSMDQPAQDQGGYKGAVKGGFAAALVIIVLAAIAYAVFG